MERLGLDPRREFPSFKYALLGAEPHSEETRRRVEEFFGIQAFNSYGLSEMNGPGVALECPARDGMHIWEDAFLVEVVDPVTLEPVGPGRKGELVLTTLKRTAMPKVRYLTRIQTSLVESKCIARDTAAYKDSRNNDTCSYSRGVNIIPMPIEAVLIGIPGVVRNYHIIHESREP